MVQIKLVRVGDEAAVGLGHHGEAGLGQLLAIRGNAFIQGLGDGGKLSETVEVNMLAVMLRLFNQLGISAVAQVGLHVLEGTPLEVVLKSRGYASIVGIVEVIVNCHLEHAPYLML